MFSIKLVILVILLVDDAENGDFKIFQKNLEGGSVMELKEVYLLSVFVIVCCNFIIC